MFQVVALRCVARNDSHTGWVGLGWACAFVFVLACRLQVSLVSWNPSDLICRPPLEGSARLGIGIIKEGGLVLTIPSSSSLISLLLTCLLVSVAVAGAVVVPVTAKVSCFIVFLVSFSPSVHIAHTARFPPRC
ncbi:hypothetical protein FJTKL_03878 [Diaporthe vaccinii]|uniref:Uncharacterized protein n=1 Tax=Diaporthe vaccinii TaxID=105482 RepID=A0ABR4F1D5_9PEZI